MRILAALLIAAVLLCQTAAGPVSVSARTVSLNEVLSDPAAFDGERVRVHGFLILQFEGNALYLSEADYRAERLDRSLWIDVGSRHPDASILSGKLAFVSGVIDAERPGHMGLRPAALVEVSDMTVDPADSRSARPWLNDPLFIILASLGLLGLIFAIFAMVSRVQGNIRGP
jgi:hypothetical protein